MLRSARWPYTLTSARAAGLMVEHELVRPHITKLEGTLEGVRCRSPAPPALVAVDSVAACVE